MKKIDLLALAQQTERLYKDVDCSFGTIRVYHVPDALLLSASLDRPEPEEPVVRMKTAGGFQDRPIKKGDKGWDSWQQERADYESEMFRLRAAKRMVAALKDLDYPDISKPPTAMANEVYNGTWPEDETLRKKIWLDFTVLAKRADSDAIINAINEMNGQETVTEEMVDEVKKNSG